VRTLGIGLAALVSIAALIVSPLIVSGYFDGDWVLMIALIVAFCAYCPAHLSRGIASGNGRFNAYAIVMGADGAMRILLCAALAIFGVKTVGLYGFAVALSPLPGVMWVKAKGSLRTEPGPEAPWAEVTPNLGWLLLGSVFAAALVNAGPLAATLLATDDEKHLVTTFTYGVLLARIPLFLFQAVQAALLPRLSRLAARNEIAEFRSGFAKLLKLVLLVGALGTVGAYLLGPFVIKRFYDATLSRQTMGMLALGSALYMVALAIAQAVIALRGHALVALGWGIGVVTFVIVTWLSSDELFRRVEFGLVSSSFAALCSFALALRARLQSGSVPSQDSVIDAVTNLPLET
jgi:O-antigen/teichoic acid export membrane protein